MKQTGYVALLAVLVVGAASLAIATGLLLTGADSSRATLASQQAAQARSLAAGCAEEALQILRDNTAFTGANTVVSSTGSCSYTVTATGANSRTVDTSATMVNAVHKVRVYVTISSSSISVTSWQDAT